MNTSNDKDLISWKEDPKKSLYLKIAIVVLFLVTVVSLTVYLRFSIAAAISLISGILLILLLLSFSRIFQKWMVLVSALAGGALFALFLAGLLGNEGDLSGIVNPVVWINQKWELLVLSIFGWLGGIIYTIISDNNLELPTASIKGKNIDPGIIGDVLIGISGALLAYHFLPDEWRASASQIAVVGIVGGYGGKVIIATVVKKFIDRIKETSLDDIKKKNEELVEENQRLIEKQEVLESDRNSIEKLEQALEDTKEEIKKVKTYDRESVDRELASLSLEDSEKLLKNEIIEPTDISDLTPRKEAAVRMVLSQINMTDVGQSRVDFVQSWASFKTDRHQRNPNLIGPGSVSLLLEALEDKKNSISGVDTLVDSLPRYIIDFITKHEGFRAVAYPDPIYGWDKPTIGYGTTTFPNGQPVRQGDKITQGEAEQYLIDFINNKCKPVLKQIPTWKDMNINQRGALYSFAYNLGPYFYKGKERESITRLCDTPSLWKDKEEVKRIFKLYCNPQDKNVTEGLKKRRGEEADLFCHPIPVGTLASSTGKGSSVKEPELTEPSALLKLDVKYYSQLDNATDRFGAGSRQCCTTSNAMLLNYLLNGQLDTMAFQQKEHEAESVYDDFVARYGDTVNHDAQTKALREFGVESYWSTKLNQDFLRQSLNAKVPIVIGVIYKRSGHIVVVVGHDPKRSGFLVHDPYGTRRGTSNTYSVGQGGDFDLYTYSSLKKIFDPNNNGWGRVVTAVKGKPTGLT